MHSPPTHQSQTYILSTEKYFIFCVFPAIVAIMTKQTPDFSLEIACGAKLVAGVDEAGRGPLCGPVVAAAHFWNLLKGAPCPASQYWKTNNQKKAHESGLFITILIYVRALQHHPSSFVYKSQHMVAKHYATHQEF